MKILVADDDMESASLLSYALRQAGFDVVSAYDGSMAVSLAQSEQPDLILLDVSMPKMDGFDVLTQIRRSSRTPVIMLTARNTEEDEIMGLNLGADDYLTKPFSPRTLLARIRALLRRGTASDGGSQPLSFAGIELDMESQLATVDGVEHQLPQLETRLLQRLLTEKGKVVRSERLIAAVWGDRESGDKQALKQLVRRLRTRIEITPAEPVRLLSVTGVGYRLVDPAGTESS